MLSGITGADTLDAPEAADDINVQAYVDGKWTSSSTKYLVSAVPKA